jgi:hypothetical protein
LAPNAARSSRRTRTEPQTIARLVLFRRRRAGLSSSVLIAAYN